MESVCLVNMTGNDKSLYIGDLISGKHPYIPNLRPLVRFHSRG